MKFSMTHKVFKEQSPFVFSEDHAPDWLRSSKTLKGSTMDNRWFWDQKIMTLEVGASVETDFRTITRIE